MRSRKEDITITARLRKAAGGNRGCQAPSAAPDILERAGMRAMPGVAGAERASVLLRALLPMLVEGEPVAPGRLAAAVGQPVAQLVSELRRVQGPVEFDVDGRIVGWGLTLRPTEHRVQVDGRTLYTWCAEETLVFPVMLGKPFQVTSPCHQTGTPIRVQVTPDGIERVEPKSAMLSVLFPTEHARLSRDSACVHGHYFSSPEAARPWLDRCTQISELDVAVMPVREAFAAGRAHARRWKLTAHTGRPAG